MNEIVEKLNEKINSFAHETNGLNIETGKMGICLYFFLISNNLKTKRYQLWAGKLLDEIYEQFDKNLSEESIFDIIQVGIGFDFLIKQKYVNGNINQILSDIDNALFKWLTSTKNQKKLTFETFGIFYILYYLYIRLKTQKPKSDCQFLIEELIIKAFNDVYSSLNSTFYDEPILFSFKSYKLPQFLYVLSKIHSTGFYNYRINEVIKEIAVIIQSRIPALHANRLYLLWGLLHLKQSTGFTFWDEQINLISQNIDIHRIIERELRNKQIFINDGISGIYLLMEALEKINCKIPFNLDLFRKQIYESDAWNENLQQPMMFVYGMSGLLWVEQLINKRINIL